MFDRMFDATPPQRSHRPARLALLVAALAAALGSCVSVTGGGHVRSASDSDGGAKGDAAEEDGAADRHALEVARMELELARLDAEESTTDAARELDDAEADLAEAQRDLAFFATERALELDEARLSLARAEGRHEDARLELLELEAMYDEDDFAEKTKELVLTRGRRNLEHAKIGLDIERRELEALEGTEHPARERKLTRAVADAEATVVAKRRAAARTAIQVKLDLSEAERSLEEAEEEAGDDAEEEVEDAP